VVVAVSIPWIGVHEPSIKTTILEYKAGVKDNIIPQFSVVIWLVTPESIIQVWDIDDIRQDIRIPIWVRVAGKRKIEPVCSVAAGTSETAQTDVAAAHHLE